MFENEDFSVIKWLLRQHCHYLVHKLVSSPGVEVEYVGHDLPDPQGLSVEAGQHAGALHHHALHVADALPEKNQFCVQYTVQVYSVLTSGTA